MKKWEKPIIQNLELKSTKDDQVSPMAWYDTFKCCECGKEYVLHEAYLLKYKCYARVKHKVERCGGKIVSKFNGICS